MANSSSLMVTGSVALDTLETPFGSSSEVLGGSASHFALTASHFVPVQMVGVVGTDFPDEHLALFRDRGIDVTYLAVEEGETFRWHGRYEGPMGEAETLEVQLNVHENFSPSFGDDPPSPDVLFLGNISPGFQREVLEGLGDRPGIVAADTMKLWIETQRQELTDVLSDIDLFFLNWEEALLLGDSDSTLKAAQNIREEGPSIVVVKKGEHGAIAFSENQTFAVPGYPLEEERDPTGAGDTFAGGVMSVLSRENELTPELLRIGLVLGTVTGSFAVESFGPGGMKNLTAEKLRDRVENYFEVSGLDERLRNRLWEMLPE